MQSDASSVEFSLLSLFRRRGRKAQALDTLQPLKRALPPNTFDYCRADLESNRVAASLHRVFLNQHVVYVNRWKDAAGSFFCDFFFLCASIANRYTHTHTF